MGRARTFGAAALLLATGAGVQPARSAILRVPDDYPSVLAAVDAAVSGDSVMVAPGTWTDTDTRVVVIGGTPRTFTSTAFLKGGVAVIGAGAGVTTIDGQESGTGFVTPLIFANDPGEAVLEGMTVTGAAGNGTGIFGDTSGRLIVRNCHVSGNNGPTSGGGIQVYGCDLLIEDSEVSFNTGVSDRAGVDGDLCEIQAFRCRFEGNQGVALVVVNFNKHDIVVEDCEFVENRMTNGAACAIADPRSVQIERNLFLRNVRTGGSGASLSVGSAFGTMQGNVFAYDSTYGGYPGAGIYCSGFSGEISENTFVGCHVDAPYNGSAVYLGSTSGVSFANNLIADCSGGGVLWIQPGQLLDGDCNGFWNNEGGLGDYVPDPTDLFLDPQFCGPVGLDFTLAESSPYTAANSSCGQIGALGEGCAPVSIEAISWGRIKQKYR